MGRRVTIYKGHRLVNHGYYAPDKRVWWEAVDEDGNANHHAHTKRDLKNLIDEYEAHHTPRERDADADAT